MTPGPSERARSDDAAIRAARREAFRGFLDVQAGKPPGQALTVSEAADEGLRIWSDVKQ
jgi:hypothetical protein